mmetsp:Transcript_30613/g.89606  ORF Transcript_30613/g.89606 Transcript_30613/m.89606 type:complete len:249 (-) Transcript_30613:85-831(-)
MIGHVRRRVVLAALAAPGRCRDAVCEGIVRVGLGRRRHGGPAWHGGRGRGHIVINPERARLQLEDELLRLVARRPQLRAQTVGRRVVARAPRVRPLECHAQLRLRRLVHIALLRQPRRRRRCGGGRGGGVAALRGRALAAWRLGRVQAAAAAAVARAAGAGGAGKDGLRVVRGVRDDQLPRRRGDGRARRAAADDGRVRAVERALRRGGAATRDRAGDRRARRDIRRQPALGGHRDHRGDAEGEDAGC